MSPRIDESILVNLPVPVRKFPYWAVLFRPEMYTPELIPSLGDCIKLVEKTRVQLRGWDFPHLSNEPTERGNGSNWVASWVNFLGSIEYWRLYQSGQFLHVAAVFEAVDNGIHAKLHHDTMSHLRHVKNIDWDKVPGYLTIGNLVYNVTERFEFAARICQAGVYRGNLDITLELNGVKGFVLTTDWNRAWWQYCAANDDRLTKTWRVSSDALIAGSAEHSMEAIVWLCECFGWLSPNVEALRNDQKKLLAGRL
jgi:hypothetical protein